MAMRLRLSIIVSEPNFCSKTSCLQMMYILWVNLAAVNIGLAYGFSAVAIPHLHQDFKKITEAELGWMASILMLAAPFSCIASGYVMDKFGRRVALLSSELLMIAGWVGTYFAQNPTHMIIGRAITGLGTGMSFLAPRVYASEIALPNMRGVSGAFPDVGIALGILIQAFLGTYLNWRYLCIVSASYSFLLLILNTQLPETPYFLLMRSTAEKARQSLMKFRSAKHNINAEMVELIEFKQDNDIRRLTNKQMFRALCALPTLKPFIIVTFFIIVAELSGINVIVFWTLNILKASESSVDPNIGNIILSVTRLGGGLLLAVVLYVTPRKAMSLISGLGISASFVTLGALRLQKVDTNVYPIVLLALYVLFASLGYHSMPTLLMSEMYPLQLRGFLGGITISVMNLMMFAMINSYPHLEAWLDFSFIVFIYGGISLLGCIFIIACVPETNGLTLSDIEEYFNNRRSTLFSQRKLMHLLVKPADQPRPLRPTPRADC